MFVVTRIDADNAQSYDEIVTALQDTFGAACTPLMIPVGSRRDFSDVVNLLQPGEVPAALQEVVEERRGALMEAVISGDDTLLERYLEGETIPTAELAQVFSQVLINGAVVPILCCSAETGTGVAELLDVVSELAPAPSQAKKHVMDAQGIAEHPITIDGPLEAQVFKVMSDEFVGKVSFIRVYAGAIHGGDTVTIANANQTVKIPKLFRPQGKEQKEVSEAGPGMIVATAKVEELHVGDTLVATKDQKPFVVPHYPLPMVSRAVEPQSRGDEAKISEGLRRLADTDPTFRFEMNAQTKELVIAGVGEQHISLMLSRLRRRGVQVTTKLPKIAYRETISSKADVRYRHKKQTGGAGQFAECAIRIEPNARGGGYEFIDKIFGGVISHSFRQSVDKGIQDKMTEGVIAGYPLVVKP
jgi:elongation factor G